MLGRAATTGKTRDGQKAETPPATATDARARRRESSNNDAADDTDEADDSRLRLETSLKVRSSAMALNRMGRRFIITMVRSTAEP